MIDQPHLLDAATARTRFGGPSFFLRHRALRLLFQVTWLLAAAWTPPPMHGWRAAILRLFGARMGRNARVYGSARVWFPPNLAMDDHAVLGPGVVCYCLAPVHVGTLAVVSQRAHLCAGTHDIDDPAFPLVARPISIGAKAWVAAEAFVGPGVTVGEGAVLGARGVATRPLDPWTVYAGNPCRPIRQRRPQ